MAIPIIEIDQPFWDIEVMPAGGFPRSLIAEMIKAILKGMKKAIESGVVEYHIGSRSLRRMSLKELTDFLKFWQSQDAIAITGAGWGMVAKRAYPTDY
jgi:hypothetical protein